MAWNSFLSIQTAKLNARKLFNLKNNIKKSKGQIVSKHGSSSDLLVTSQVPSYAMDMAMEQGTKSNMATEQGMKMK